MKNGIYSLIFRSDGEDFGSGILVVKDDLVNGGDSIYSYKGFIEEDRLILNLAKHNMDSHSLFGNLGVLKLNLVFHDDTQGYILKGNIENIQTVPLLVYAKFIGDLIEL
ncbi:GrlR family regulatory protein [Acinetobacter sp.]|uniref:GrlR family regulatory protein n=1 Tax=Acinetobacter sp. TaxID=472 RepID=UPI002FDA6A32